MTLKPLHCIAAALLLLAAAIIMGWQASAALAESWHMNDLCGTSMTSYGRLQVGVGYVATGVFALSGLTVLALAFCLRTQHRATSSTSTKTTV